MVELYARPSDSNSASSCSTPSTTRTSSSQALNLGDARLGTHNLGSIRRGAYSSPKFCYSVWRELKFALLTLESIGKAGQEKQLEVECEAIPGLPALKSRPLRALELIGRPEKLLSRMIYSAGAGSSSCIEQKCLPLVYVARRDISDGLSLQGYTRTDE